MTDSDLDLVGMLHRARGNDTSATRTILHRIRQPLLGRIRFMMGEAARQRMESGDVLQQVFLELLEGNAVYTIQNEEHLLRWLARTARHFILESVRKKHEAAMTSFLLESGLISTDDSGDPVAAARNLEAMEDVATAMSGLDADSQRVMELRYFEFLSFKEIAERLERSPNAVQLLHARTLARLGQHLRRKP